MLQHDASSVLMVEWQASAVLHLPCRNYGLLPQTWEDPAHKNEDAGGVFVSPSSSAA
jgi:hypothetical protein